MANDYVKFSGGIIEKGIDNFSPDFNTAIVLTPDSKNLMQGINRGTGPRYGISPMPGHSTLDNTIAADSRGLRCSEQASGDAKDLFRDRKKFLGVIPMTIGSYDDLTIKAKMFLWLIADNYTGTSYALTASPNVKYTAGTAHLNLYKYRFNVSFGFNNPLWQQPANYDDNSRPGVTDYNSPLIKRINYTGISGSATKLANMGKALLGIGSGVFYASSSIISVSGKQWPHKWLIGNKSVNGSANTTATATMIQATVGGDINPVGICPAWNLNTWKRSTRTLEFFNFSGGQLMISYQYVNQTVTDSTYIAAFNQANTANYALTGTATATANERGAAFVANDIAMVLMNDNELICDSSYTMAMVAAGKSLAYIIQDWERDLDGRNVQMISLLDRVHKPNNQVTLTPGGAGFYTEDGIKTQTCWEYWPAYVTGTPLITHAANANVTGAVHVTLGAANSGILRANTVYEMAFSIFDKQYGTETNVGKPARFLTGTDDHVAVSILRDKTTAGVYQQFNSITQTPVFSPGVRWGVTDTSAPISYSTRSCLNYLELRVYYRPLGSYEWLPALFVDVPQFSYYPNFRELWACQGNVAALPGGQPGGFIDYSFLGDDAYDCTFVFKNRAFWMSPKNMIFSLANNSFAYPLRNNTPAPTGGFKGAIVHTYRGQSEQQSRLVVFGIKETYIARFTGEFAQMPIVVSPDVTANYDVDGSDFRIESWTSVTAWSYRAAVVADGILYWWGPQGIYRDDGVGVPTKISRHLEPDIFELYYPAATDEIHCIYDEKTKDIMWFYPPRFDSTKTHALTYDVELGEFFIQRFDFKIDWAQRIDTGSVIQDSVNGVTTVFQNTNGLRTIIAARETSGATIQRGYYFDSINRSGDMKPKTELICKTMAAGSASNLKVLTFDSGLDATNFATIAVGDYIAIQQYKRYTGLLTGDDVIAKVNAIDLITPSLTIQIPTNATLTNQANDPRFYFPIWHKAASGDGLNGIPWEWRTKYWLSSSINDSYLYVFLYMFFKYTAWKKLGNNTISVAYRTPSGADFITDSVNLTDNSDTNCQIFHALREGSKNSQGQAIKLKLSGSHIGEEWMLQYLGAHATVQQGNILKEYQG